MTGFKASLVMVKYDAYLACDFADHFHYNLLIVVVLSLKFTGLLLDYSVAMLKTWR